VKIGDRIKKLRKQKDLKQAELAALVGVSVQVVSNWERHYTTIIPYDEIEKLARIFKVPATFILFGEEENRQMQVNESSNSYKPIQDIIHISLNRADNPLSDLPPEALEEIDNFLNYIKHKYKVDK